MDLSEDERRLALAAWLRTGRLPRLQVDGVELKFNPYHDPRNGRFTFAPGGPRSLRYVVVSDRRITPGAESPAERAAVRAREAQDLSPVETDVTAGPKDAVYRPEVEGAESKPASFPRNPRAARGGDSRAFQDPITLEQVFPGLRDAPAGAVVALADNVFDLSGPAREMAAELTRSWSNRLIEQIKAVDPAYEFQSLGVPTTLEGQVNQLNGLRLDRAAALFRAKGELRPLQVETLRTIQERTDQAYSEGTALLRAGELKVRLNEQ